MKHFGPALWLTFAAHWFLGFKVSLMSLCVGSIVIVALMLCFTSEERETSYES